MQILAPRSITLWPAASTGMYKKIRFSGFHSLPRARIRICIFRQICRWSYVAKIEKSSHAWPSIYWQSVHLSLCNQRPQTEKQRVKSRRKISQDESINQRKHKILHLCQVLPARLRLPASLRSLISSNLKKTNRAGFTCLFRLLNIKRKLSHNFHV